MKERILSDLGDFPITRRRPPRNPLAIQLYSLPTPNGVKVSIALEELGLPYDAHLIDFAKNDQTSPEFLSLNPNNKIPAIIDPQGAGGQPLALFESGAILLYLTEKPGRLIPEGRRWQTIQWLMFQMGGIGPMFGQLGHFHHFAGKEVDDPRPKERCRAEVERLLKVLDGALASREWIAGGVFHRRYRDLPLAADAARFLQGGGYCGLAPAEACPGLAGPVPGPPCRAAGLVQPPRN